MQFPSTSSTRPPKETKLKRSRDKRETAGIWIGLFALFTALGVLEFGYRYLDDLARARSGTWTIRLIEQSTGVYTALLLLPIVLWHARRFPWQTKRWFRFTIAHLAGALTYSLAHTTLMALSRQSIFSLLDRGSYDYGIMGYRYPMELSNDFIGYAIWIGCFYSIQRIRQARQREVVAAQLEARLAEAQLENLRLQLNPHFLFNTLNMISAVMYEDVKSADAMIARLSDLLRFTLRTESKPEIRFAEELDITRTYLEIMKARFEDKLQVHYDVGSGLEEALIPQLILQPLVENAVRHGMNEESGLQINVRAARRQNDLVIQIRDTGPGVANEEISRAKGGIGLANTRARLEQLYGSEQRFEIESEPGGGTDVTLTLPYKTAAAAAS